MNSKKTIIGGIIIVSIIALSAIAFADYGYGGRMMGYGGGHMMGPGYNHGYMMGQEYYGGHMMGWDNGYENLSGEQRAALDAAQEKFDNETIDLRRQIDEKQFALHNELIKENPNNDKVVDLQKEISKLQAAFDRKAVEHELEIRKLLPENEQRQSYGAWSGGNGYCW